MSILRQLRFFVKSVVADESKRDDQIVFHFDITRKQIQLGQKFFALHKSYIHTWQKTKTFQKQFDGDGISSQISRILN